VAVDPTLAIESLRSLRKTPASQPGHGAGRAADDTAAVPFDRYLQEAQRGTNGVRFSGHAQRRLTARGIMLKPTDVQRLEHAVDRAAAKGSRDSLVLMNNLALVVDIRNRTVVTAVDNASQKEGIFTNIDSVVLTENR